MNIAAIKTLLPNQHRPIQVLQVFYAGRPCGWLGLSDQGYWFHYSSNTVNQAWVCLLMPPSTNFYLAPTLFPAFAQHLPGPAMQQQVQELYCDVQLGELDYLYLFNTSHLGPVSYANPDNPVVVRNPYINLEVLDQEFFGNHDLEALPLSSGATTYSTGCLIRTTPRDGPPDTLLLQTTALPTIHALIEAKKKADPLDRLPGLRWISGITISTHYYWFSRPDKALWDQKILGMEKMTSVLNLSELEYDALLSHKGQYVSVIEEVIRTFCPNSAAEIMLFKQLVNLLTNRAIQAFVIYQQAKPLVMPQRPKIVGLEYLPCR